MAASTGHQAGDAARRSSSAAHAGRADDGPTDGDTCNATLANAAGFFSAALCDGMSACAIALDSASSSGAGALSVHAVWAAVRDGSAFGPAC